MHRPRRLLCLSFASLLILPLTNPAAAFHHKETIGAATLEAHADHDRAGIALSDVVHVVVKVEGGKGLQVEMPVRPVAGAAWEVLASSAPPPKAGEDGKVRWQQTITLAPTAPGDLKLELTSLVYRDGDSESRTVAWKPFTVPVETQIKELDVAKARDITSLEELPSPPPNRMPLWPWFVLPPALVVLTCTALWLVWRRRLVGRQATALQKALHECDRLLGLKLREPNRDRNFVVLLSGIVRRFLERHYELPARRRTTAEVLQDVATRTDMNDEAKRWLRTYFEQVDHVKFAGGALGTERCHALVQEVRQFCAAAQDGKASVTFSKKETGEVG